VNQPRKTALWKKLALSLTLPIALFAGGELALRVCGFGEPLTFFVRDDRPGYLRTNPAFTSLVFPASFGLKPENFRITKKKAPGTFRVFVLGESAAMGVPEPGFGLAPQLQALWRAAYPQRRVEVYNLGVTAINSHCVRLIAEEALELEPDLLVLYMGNNEVVGPFGPGSGLTAANRSLAFIRTSLWVRSTRTGQFIQQLASKLIGRGNGPPEWRGMEMFTGRTVPAGDSRLSAVYEHFEANLRSILSSAAQRKVPVALCTVAVNVHDCSPFASVHRTGLSSAQLDAWEVSTAAANEAIDLQQWTEARTLLAKSLALDGEYAETHYQQASVLERLNEPRLARQEYFAALQLDALRFRADAEINEIIRQVGGSFKNVALVDTADALGASPESPRELAGRNYFFEHVHLNWEGNYALASAVSSAISPDGARPRIPAMDIDTLAKRVGFTLGGRGNQLLRMNELTRRPPFTGQATYAHDRTVLQEQFSAVARRLENKSTVEECLSVVADASAKDPENSFLPFHMAQLQILMGRTETALAANHRASELEPESPELLAQKAYLELQGRDFAAAESTLRRAQKEFPYYFQTYGLLAQVWSASGRTHEGVKWFAELVAQMPQSRAALEMYGQLLRADGDDAKAETVWRRTVALLPDSEGSLMPLVQRLLATQRADEAVQLLERAYQYNPQNLSVAAILEQIYEGRGDVDNRIKYMRAMIESGPVRPKLFLDLGVLLRERKSLHEAELQFHRAIQAARLSGDEQVAEDATKYLASSPRAH
jgi:tetratricopeptide (TPR) repeat protein